MSLQGFTKATDIDITGTPWSVDAQSIQHVYVLNDGVNDPALYKDDAGATPFSPANLDVEKSVSSGLYFHISTQSVSGTEFANGVGSSPQPVTWDSGTLPSTVTYGKFQTDNKAFSMKDFWNHASNEDHSFDVNVKLPNGEHINLRSIVGIDPTIVERGEEPPTPKLSSDSE